MSDNVKQLAPRLLSEIVAERELFVFVCIAYVFADLMNEDGSLDFSGKRLNALNGLMGGDHGLWGKGDGGNNGEGDGDGRNSGEKTKQKKKRMKSAGAAAWAIQKTALEPEDVDLGKGRGEPPEVVDLSKGRGVFDDSTVWVVRGRW